ncbi:hypothetical protein LGK97_05520 [Clostridium sp. CS001]|uniref:hypothetical protein n=1 Tax=Clostridium sp. CS001 TaxID=2880648 RepID=UPI001CF3C374|nr:hypothetical protein [Clostridium sp. CS001]MCB2289222.1 hypothetical protein [Clostridium sp. CS001]
MNMYRNLGEKSETNITGNIGADKIIMAEINKNSVVNKIQLKKILWKKFKETFR